MVRDGTVTLFSHMVEFNLYNTKLVCGKPNLCGVTKFNMTTKNASLK